MANNPSAAPVHKIDDAVFLMESAAIGHLEKYAIDGIRWDTQTGQWLYSINLKRVSNQTPPTNSLGYGTRTRSMVLEFRESELGTFCEASEVVEAYLSSQLDRIRALRTSQGCSTTG